MPAEASLRKLWRECFADTPEYEAFYFNNVYVKNTVYKIEDGGMLHLNPYLCQVKKKRMQLCYIVGVGTARAKRRKGIMAALIKQALGDLYSQRHPFTYLMPADVRYYEPFSFTAIAEKQSICFRNTTYRIQQIQGDFSLPHMKSCFNALRGSSSRSCFKPFTVC